MRFLTAIILSLGTALFSHTELLDRVAVTVGTTAITATQVDLEVRLTDFLNNEPVALNAEARRSAAERLVEQTLIKREIEFGRYPVPDESTSDDLIAAVREKVHGKANLIAALAKYGLSENDLKTHLVWQATLLRFLDLRFRPAVEVTNQDIQTYYETKVLPNEKPGHHSSLEEVRSEIRRTLSSARADQQLEQWLKETRKTTEIEFHPEAFQ